MEQVKNRVSGMEDNVEEVEQTVKEHERMMRKYEHARYLGYHEKIKPTNYGYRRRRGDTN
jgi:hypothetical protein